MNNDAVLKRWLIPLYALLTVGLVGGTWGWWKYRQAQHEADVQKIVEAMAAAPQGTGELTFLAVFTNCAVVQAQHRGSSELHRVVRTGPTWKAELLHDNVVDTDPLLSGFSETACQSLDVSPRPSPVFARYTKASLHPDTVRTITVYTDLNGCAYFTTTDKVDVLLALPPTRNTTATPGALSNGIVIADKGIYTLMGARHPTVKALTEPEFNLKVPAECEKYAAVFLVDSGVASPAPPVTTPGALPLLTAKP